MNLLPVFYEDTVLLSGVSTMYGQKLFVSDNKIVL